MLENNINTLAISKSDVTLYPDYQRSNFRSQGVQADSKNFVSAFADLKIDSMLPPEKSLQTSPRCPCGCLQHSTSIGGFRTRELSSMRLIVHGPEILNYQGTKQAPEDVAPYWKKDSRMWLWKSVRLARRERNKPKTSATSNKSLF